MNAAQLAGMRMVAGLRDGRLDGIEAPVVVGMDWQVPGGKPVYGYRVWKGGRCQGETRTMAGAQELFSAAVKGGK